MSIKPILFNGQMVRAILDGRKTQTRRINKDGSEFSVPDMSFFDPVIRTYAIRNYADYEHQQRTSLVQAPVPICPGDVLYVRETWREDFEYAGDHDRTLYFYRADHAETSEYSGPWRPSIHMPKAAARIFLRVTDVRVERLWDISSEDVYAEGTDNRLWAATRDAFRRLWDSTIKPADRDRYGWGANPWVWVISFERYDELEDIADRVHRDAINNLTQDDYAG